MAPLEGVAERVDRLERALGNSNKQLASLQSDVATLVHAIGDIRRQIVRPHPAPPAPPAPSSPPARARMPMRKGTAIAGLIIGLCTGIFGWKYFTGESDVAMAPPAAATPVSAQALAADPPAVPPPGDSAPAPPQEAAVAIDVSQAPAAPQAPRHRGTQAPKYVGTLSIDADPGGEVFINRKSAGRTPLRVANLRAGSHLIWIERVGYRRWTRVVQVPADRVTRISADLEPIPAR